MKVFVNIQNRGDVMFWAKYEGSQTQWCYLSYLTGFSRSSMNDSDEQYLETHPDEWLELLV